MKNLKSMLIIFTFSFLLSCSNSNIEDDIINTKVQIPKGSPFITVWNTNISYGSSNTNQILIPLNPNFHYDFEIDWGDGVVEQIQGSVSPVHTYEVAGIKEIKITGQFPQIHFLNMPEKFKIQSIKQWGDIKWKSFDSSFYGCQNLEVEAQDTPDLSQVSSLAQMFKSNHIMKGTMANWDWDTSTITDMSSMFSIAQQFNGDISGWDTSKVTNMSTMFESTKNFNQDISLWDTTNVTQMIAMFRDSTGFTYDLSSWKVNPNITSCQLFAANSSSFTIPLFENCSPN